MIVEMVIYKPNNKFGHSLDCWKSCRKSVGTNIRYANSDILNNISIYTSEHLIVIWHIPHEFLVGFLFIYLVI